MEALIFILFIVFAIAGNKGKAEAKKRREQARRVQPPAYTPPPTAADALPGAAFDWPAEGAASENPVPASGSLAYDSSEGLNPVGDAEGVSLEGMRGSHVVRPFTEGTHSHIESSLTGDIPCPPVSAFQGGLPPRAAHRQADTGLRLDLAGVRQGLIYAEILGKPRALRGRAHR